MSNEMNDDDSDFDENNRVGDFVNQFLISEELAAEIVKKIGEDLRKALKQNFPYEMLPFGSYVNGLCSIDSDVDVCLRIAPLVSSPKQIPELNRIRKLLYKNVSFNCIVPIGKAKVPIIKFKHAPTRVDCDLSVDNEIGVQNTFLVKSYLSMNSKLKTVVLVLKHLLSMNNLKGTGKITTYILFWMVVFYMQQLDLLPPVMNARESSPNPRSTISGWNCAIPQILAEPLQDPHSIRRHVRQFCHFYSNFDWANFVVCPYLSCQIRVDDFKTVKLPADLFSSYIDNVRDEIVAPFPIHIINVQDPTSLNHNLTRSVSQRTLDSFKHLCASIVQFIRHNTNVPLSEVLSKSDPRLRVALRRPLSIPTSSPTDPSATATATATATGASKAKRRKKNKKANSVATIDRNSLHT